MKNHTVSLDILDSGPGEARRAGARIILIILEKKVQFKVGFPRAAIEASPNRWAKRKASFHAKDKFAMCNEPGGWQLCSRGLELWDKTQSRKLGCFYMAADRWTWNPTAIRESYLTHPDEYKPNEVHHRSRRAHP